MKIIVERREVYGQTTIYPVCQAAQLFAEIAGTKTLTAAALIKIEKLGYEIEQPAPKPITMDRGRLALATTGRKRSPKDQASVCGLALFEPPLL